MNDFSEDTKIKSKVEAKWNEKLEDAVRNIGEDSKSYKLMHIYEAQRANRIYTKLTMAGIILGPLTGIIAGIDTTVIQSKEPILSITATVLGFLSGIVVAVIKFGRYDEFSNANKQAAARYTSIESNVRRQLGLYREDRVPATLYMEWLETKYGELFLSAPLLPSDVYDKFSQAENTSVLNRYEDIISINDDYEKAEVKKIVDVTNIEINNGYKVSREQEIKGQKQIKRSYTMSQFPELNQYSDKMLEYEMKRMLGF
jgi:F0F1-type ATP synthase assembly protein I